MLTCALVHVSRRADTRRLDHRSWSGYPEDCEGLVITISKSKYETLTLWWFNVGPASQTAVQHQTNVKTTSRARLVVLTLDQHRIPCAQFLKRLSVFNQSIPRQSVARNSSEDWARRRQNSCYWLVTNVNVTHANHSHFMLSSSNQPFNHNKLSAGIKEWSTFSSNFCF